jgi:catechol 2,3-dioxygenase-like lactoylglutathione lyase family enzyme
MVTFLTLHHVQLAMPAGREEDARAFFSNVLGIPEVPKPPVLAARGGAWFECGEVRIHVGVEPSFRPARKAHPALVVDDLATLVETCKRHGVPVKSGEDLPGFIRVHIEDPFGNRIEVMQAVEPD